ncbi:MAG: ADP-ribosylglycohydrolase-domain-containing protein [Podila humilis]|nr:MAG: ADP-ribosylglycohydrolase-domain-containing protein [Podila humilis]
MATLSTLTKDQIRDRIRGCLLGNAVGDAYGLATEFMSKKSAKERYGNGPIHFGTETEGYPVWLDMHRSKWDRNDFTDDTDQLLLILQSLENTKDGKLHPANFAKKLKEWSIIGFPELGTPPRGIGYTVGSTLTHSEFRFNPHKAAFDIWNSKGRTLAANGAVMRTAVLGVESFWDEHIVVINSLAAAKVTHADPRSIVSALISSVLISRFLRGGGQSAENDAAHGWNPRLGTEAYEQELLEYLERGTDIRQEASSEPVYEEETSENKYVNKDDRAFRKARAEKAAAIEKAAAEKAAESSGSTTIFGTIKKVFTFKDPSSKEIDSDDWNSHRPVVKLREDIGWAGIDNVGESEAVTALAKSVIADYKFLLLKTEVVPPTIKKITPLRSETTGEEEEEHKTQAQLKSIQEKWADELESHCFPAALQELELGDGAKMGYTFKCIGAGYYGVTREVDPSPTICPQYEGPQGLFRGVMEQLTLEAGDADTNGAVVGSLLGARFGLKNGIPHNWWSSLKHLEWMDTVIDQFTDRIMAAYEKEI